MSSVVTAAATEQRVLSRLADLFLDLGHPLEALEVRERLRPAQDLGAAERDQELLRVAERAHPQRARADALAARARRSRRPSSGRTCVRTGAPRRSAPRTAAARCRPRTRRCRRGGGAASPGRGSCASGRRGGGDRRGRPARGSPRSCRRTDMPRGISRSRKRPITSPWSSVLISSPGITIRSRPRASSTVSSAPPKTLWSVTAIAPSPSASAWSTSSAGSTVQSNDHEVCMWRSATIHGRSASGSAARRRRLRRRCVRRRVEVVELRRDGLERLALRPRRAPRPARARAARRPRRDARPPPPRAPAAPRRRPAPRSRSRRPAPRAARAASPSIPGTKIAVSSSSAARAAPSRAVRTRTRPARSRGIAGRADERRRPQQHRLPAGQLAQRVQDAARAGALVRPQLDDDQRRASAPGAKSSRIDAGRDEP